jgi:hypothetical protein
MSDNPTITIIKKAQTKSLEGRATLTYHIAIDDSGAVHWAVVKNTGGGFFDSSFVGFDTIQSALSGWPKELPITSMALRGLFKGKSVNTPSFLLATLVKENIVEPMPNRKRHYQLCDPTIFQTHLDELKAQHSSGSKGKPTAKAKTGSSMPKAKKKPATG